MSSLSLKMRNVKNNVMKSVIIPDNTPIARINDRPLVESNSPPLDQEPERFFLTIKFIRADGRPVTQTGIVSCISGIPDEPGESAEIDSNGIAKIFIRREGETIRIFFPDFPRQEKFVDINNTSPDFSVPSGGVGNNPLQIGNISTIGDDLTANMPRRKTITVNDGHTYVDITVKDKITGNPIVNADVKFLYLIRNNPHAPNEYVHKSTDENGHVRILFYGDEERTIEVTHDNYASKQATINADPYKLLKHEFSLVSSDAEYNVIIKPKENINNINVKPYFTVYAQVLGTPDGSWVGEAHPNAFATLNAYDDSTEEMMVRVWGFPKIEIHGGIYENIVKDFSPQLNEEGGIIQFQEWEPEPVLKRNDTKIRLIITPFTDDGRNLSRSEIIVYNSDGTRIITNLSYLKKLDVIIPGPDELLFKYEDDEGNEYKYKEFFSENTTKDIFLSRVSEVSNSYKIIVNLTDPLFESGVPPEGLVMMRLKSGNVAEGEVDKKYNDEWGIIEMRVTGDVTVELSSVN